MVSQLKLEDLGKALGVFGTGGWRWKGHLFLSRGQCLASGGLWVLPTTAALVMPQGVPPVSIPPEPDHDKGYLRPLAASLELLWMFL